jgi:hypothetical protein
MRIAARQVPVGFLQRPLAFLQERLTEQVIDGLVTWAIRILLAVVAVLSAYAMLFLH